MSNFIYNGGSFPLVMFPKSDRAPIPIGEDGSKWVDMTDWNAACQALLDIQGWARGAQWIGVTPQRTDPAPAGVSDYVWLRNDNTWMHNSTPIGNGGATAFRYTAAGSEGDDFLVSLPSAMATTNYNASVTTGGVANFMLVDVIAADNTLTTIHVQTSTPLQAGDVLLIQIFTT